MIRHIVFWKVKDSYDGLSKREICQKIKGLLHDCQGQIPGLTQLEVGMGDSGLEATFDVALFSTFVDKAALDAYQTHPVHEKAKAYIGQVRTARECMDYEV